MPAHRCTFQDCRLQIETVDGVIDGNPSLNWQLAISNQQLAISY
jgi:hypothetical protein